MKHLISKDDLKFKQQVESCEFPVPDFDHRAHLRLAYIYLAESSKEVAVLQVRSTLLGLLKHAGIDPSQKYHETLTEAWILAVHHFMSCEGSFVSSDDFIEANPALMDSKIMMTHYSADVLFSEKARNSFVEPDLDQIPGHGV